jgi:hypothetical protein
MLEPVLVLLNHYLWFVHFSNPPMPASYSIYDTPRVPSFSEIASYFGICVWLVPFALFVSLSAGDNVLPTMSSEQPGEVAGMGVGIGSSDGRSKGRQGMAKAVVDAVRNGLGAASEAVGIGKGDRVKAF